MTKDLDFALCSAESIILGRGIIFGLVAGSVKQAAGMQEGRHKAGSETNRPRWLISPLAFDLNYLSNPMMSVRG